MSPADDRYYERLQTFRGAGVLMVAFWHCQAVIGGQLPTRPLVGLDVGPAHAAAHYLALALFNGHAAVVTFFVLSGFVLTLSLRRGSQDIATGSARFLVARWWRIVPNNAVAILVAVALASFAGAAPQALDPPPWSPTQVAANMLLLETAISPVAWSLAVELLAVPVILALYFGTRRYGSGLLRVAMAASVALSFAPGLAVSRPFGRNLFAIVLGMLVAEHGAAFARRLTPRAAAASMLAALALWCLPRGLLGYWSHWPALIEAGAAAVLIALLAFGPRQRLSRLFEIRPLLWLGEISYSLFLYHALLLPWIVPRLFVDPRGWQLLLAVLGAWAISVLITLPIAWLSYVSVERPAITVGAWLNRYLVGRPIAAPTAIVGAQPDSVTSKS